MAEQEKLNWILYKEQCIDGCEFVTNEDDQMDLKCSAVDEFSFDVPEAEMLKLALQQRDGLLFYQSLAKDALSDKSLKGRSELGNMSGKLALIPDELKLLDLIVSSLQDDQ